MIPPVRAGTEWLWLWMPFLPDWAVSLVILAVAAGAALLVHRVSVLLVARLRLQRHRRDWLATFVTATRRPSRLLVLVIFLRAALPATAFPDGVATPLARTLLIGFILLVGWCAIRAFEIFSTLYLNRFRTDVDDNLLARKHVTQIRVLKRAVDILIVLVSVGAALMTFPSVREYGVSLFASAGVASLVVGLSARPLLTNLIAGLQIAITQPIRVEDAVIVEGEWGWIEEIAATYVVVRLWDWRRMVLPLSYFLEKPFQNWTRDSASLIGSVFLYLDYTAPVDAVRRQLERIARDSPLWDGRVVTLQVSDAKERVIELRALVSARNAPQAWDLRCEVREKLIAFLRDTCPGALPTMRIAVES